MHHINQFTYLVGKVVFLFVAAYKNFVCSFHVYKPWQTELTVVFSLCERVMTELTASVV
jgi:hypothetical protein